MIPIKQMTKGDPAIRAQEPRTRVSFRETRDGISETTLVQPALSDATRVHPVEPTKAQPTQVRPAQARLRPAAAGRKLQDRYRLDELLVDREDTQTWRAYDEKLLRPIVVHLLPADAQGNLLLAAARHIARASYDSRVLRVLDASAPADLTNPDSENFVVCDFAEGESLEDLLAVGSISRREAVTFVREVAEALVGMHAQGLYHRALSPALVTLTCEGNVKIAGFLFAAELSPARTPIVNPEAADVQALGHMLRALGADESPNANLALTSARILDPTHPAPLRTAAEVTAHLTRALDDPPLPPPASDVRTWTHQTPDVIVQEPVDTPWEAPRKGFRWAWVLVPLLVAAIIGSILAVPMLHKALTGSAATSASGAAPERWSVVAAQDFDPEGNGEERPNQVTRAWDGDSDTSWRTMNYWEAEIGNKTGVGLIFDLGEVRKVSRVELELDGAGTSLEVRVPSVEAATRPPLQGVGQWTVVGQASQAPSATSVTLDAPADTRFVLVYLTELPRDGSAFTGGIAEARFWS